MGDTLLIYSNYHPATPCSVHLRQIGPLRLLIGSTKPICHESICRLRTLTTSCGAPICSVAVLVVRVGAELDDNNQTLFIERQTYM